MENGVGIAMDVDEFCVGEKFEQEPDTGCVRRRFQDERTAVAPLKFLQKRVEGVAPFSNFGRVNVAKGEIFFELFFLTQKHPAHAG